MGHNGPQWAGIAQAGFCAWMRRKLLMLLEVRRLRSGGVGGDRTRNPHNAIVVSNAHFKALAEAAELWVNHFRGVIARTTDNRRLAAARDWSSTPHPKT